MASFTRVILFTRPDGKADFREEMLELEAGDPQVHLSELMPASALQLRQSPAGFRSAVHVTTQPQWVFILSGVMEIGLLDGTSRIFRAGEHFFSADTLPEGVNFDPEIHGHWSRQLGEEPLVTAFVKAAQPGN
jgi:hypothetical protein